MTFLETNKKSVRVHLRLGWLHLALFFSMGLALEALHGFKIEWYLGAHEETRRLMWRLAHAHGALLGLVHIALGATWAALPTLGAPRKRFISRGITVMGVFMPLGFFLGGVLLHGGDPGIGVILVPIGALGGIAAAVCLARAPVETEHA